MDKIAKIWVTFGLVYEICKAISIQPFELLHI